MMILSFSFRQLLYILLASNSYGNSYFEFKSSRSRQNNCFIDKKLYQYWHNTTNIIDYLFYNTKKFLYPKSKNSQNKKQQTCFFYFIWSGKGKVR